MSLTAHLKDNDSPIRQFIRGEFPNTRPLLADARKQVKRADVIKPGIPVDWSTIGTAIDYRIRYYFDVSPHQNLVAYAGAGKLTDLQPLPKSVHPVYRWNGEGNDSVEIFDKVSGKQLGFYLPEDQTIVEYGDGILSRHFLSPDLEELRSEVLSNSTNLPRPLKKEYADFFDSLNAFTARCNPQRVRLKDSEEHELNGHCIVLALLEQVFRAGLQSHSPLATGVFSDVNDLLQLADLNWLNDMRALSWSFYDNFNSLLYLPHVLNPTFDGSSRVGGADADLIAGNTLIDIKTSIKSEISSDFIWQLLGYALLDYSDYFQINAIGLYMCRQSMLFQWDLEQAIAILSPAKPKSIANLRTEFRCLAETLS